MYAEEIFIKCCLCKEYLCEFVKKRRKKMRLRLTMPAMALRKWLESAVSHTHTTMNDTSPANGIQATVTNSISRLLVYCIGVTGVVKIDYAT